MGIRVTSGTWKSEREMIGIVSEAETKYYGGKVCALIVQVYVPQNTAKIYMFHIFCLMYIIWFLDIF